MDHLTEMVAELAGTFSGKLGVAARNLTTGECLAYQAEMDFHPASTVKLPVLVAVYRQMDAGSLSLDETLPLDPALSMPDGGVMDGFTPGYRYPVRDLCHLMITISDNTATNLLLKRIGIESVNRLYSDLGMTNSRLNRYVAIDTERVPLGHTTPSDMLRLLESLAKEQAASPEACRLMIATMLQQKHHNLVTRYIGDWDEELEPEQVRVRIASKSGSFRTVRNDVAIVWAPRGTYVLAIYSKECKDARYNVDSEADVLLPKVSRAIYEAWGA